MEAEDAIAAIGEPRVRSGWSATVGEAAEVASKNERPPLINIIVARVLHEEEALVAWADGQAIRLPKTPGSALPEFTTLINLLDPLGKGFFADAINGWSDVPSCWQTG